MKKHIITLLVVLMAATIGAQAQSRLEPMTQTEQELWGKEYFGTWFSKKARQQMLKFPTLLEDFPSALYIYCGKGESGRLQVKRCVVNEEAEENEAMLKLDSIELETDKATALKFSDLIEHAVKTCTFNDERLGFDGTTYFFGNSIRVATIWSPESGSNCKRLTDVLEKAMTAVKNQSEEELKALLPEVESLTKVFKKLYPKD
ncbi:MAG: hypothetical protein J5733_05660 [Bacteroidaceae bacterium]|nr:hypothetical protein [Bacteroidaceae bacterium]